MPRVCILNLVPVRRVCLESFLFDSALYLAKNTGVVTTRINPLTHYLSNGTRENTPPTPTSTAR